MLGLAGDIGAYMRSWGFIEQELKRSAVIYGPGNHECYCWQKRAPAARPCISASGAIQLFP